jgi:hypothetical protein
LRLALPDALTLIGECDEQEGEPASADVRYELNLVSRKYNVIKGLKQLFSQKCATSASLQRHVTLPVRVAQASAKSSVSALL